jgi:hypothetical protein
LQPNPVHRRAAHRQLQPLALRAATAQHFRAGVFGANRDRLGRVEVELIATLTKVLIALDLHEQHFEASLREVFELVCFVLPQGATRGFNFVKNEASNMEALKNNAPINSQCIPGFNPEMYQNLPGSGKRKLPKSHPDLRVSLVLASN